jgi:hypothetical protein
LKGYLVCPEFVPRSPRVVGLPPACVKAQVKTLPNGCRVIKVVILCVVVSKAQLYKAPFLSKGLFVITFITPPDAFTPQRVELGPFTTSTLSMRDVSTKSSLVRLSGCVNYNINFK